MGVHLSDQSFRDDSDRQADYGDFLKRFQSDPTSISTEEAARRYHELISHAPPELAAEANQQIMGLLPPSDREVLADNIAGSRQNIGVLDNILGKDSPLNSPLGKLILSAVVAYLANRMLSQQSEVGGRAPSGGLGDLISTILSAAARGQAPAQQVPAGGLPGGLGDILGALTGGGASGQAPSGGLGDILGALTGGDTSAQQQAPSGGLPGGLGDILGALTGGQSQASGGLPGGLGDILGGLMQGEAPADAPKPASEPQPRAKSHRKS